MALFDFETITVGTPIPPLIKQPLTMLQIIKYAGASGDFNPLHVMGTKHFPPIAHGTLLAEMAGQYITNWAGVGSVKKFRADFKSPAEPGALLTIKGTVKRKYTDETGRYLICRIIITDENEVVKMSARATLNV